MCLDTLLLVGLVGFELFSRGGWPVGKTQTGRKSGFTSGPCPGLCLHRVPPWRLWEKGVWHNHLGGCQHPLGGENHFRGDIQGFASGFLGQKPKGKELERSSDHSARQDVLWTLLLLHEHLGKGDVGTQL